jgi:hypothetical protein
MLLGRDSAIWHGVDMTAEAKAIIAKIRASKLESVAA